MVDGQVIQDGPDTLLLTYDYPCTSEKSLYVIAVDGCGATAPVYGGSYTPLCEGYRSAYNVMAYPNPASSQLMIQLNGETLAAGKQNADSRNLIQITSVKLYDKTGRQRKSLSFGKGSRQVSLNVAELTADVYYVEVSDGVRSVRIPVLIRH